MKNIKTSGSAAKLTNIVYAFGNTTGGRCAMGDSYAAYDKYYDAAGSVDGVADTWDTGALRGNFNQLRKLKREFPNIKVVWSFGGWTWSGGFTEAAQEPGRVRGLLLQPGRGPALGRRVRRHRHRLGVPERLWAELRHEPARTPSTTSITALRNRFGSSSLVTAAITADGTNGGKIDATDYATAIAEARLDHGDDLRLLRRLQPAGPDRPALAADLVRRHPDGRLPQRRGDPEAEDQGHARREDPARHRRSTAAAGPVSPRRRPGGRATGAAPGKYEAGIEDYKLISTRCPSTGTVGGTAYAFCNGQWWGYDTPATIRSKMAYANNQGLGGAFIWELSGDTADGALITAVKTVG